MSFCVYGFTGILCRWLYAIKNTIDPNGGFDTDDKDAYIDARQGVDTEEGVLPAAAKWVFREDRKTIIEELNRVLVA